MPFIVTETHYEYNDETYNSPDARHGEEPGVPVAIFDNSTDAENERWKREIAKWRNLGSEITGYVYDIRSGEPWSGSRTYQSDLDAYNDKKRRYAELAGVDALSVKFDYGFAVKSGLSDETMREIIELFDGPHFFNVFAL